jgi:hypothetical protein
VLVVLVVLVLVLATSLLPALPLFGPKVATEPKQEHSTADDVSNPQVGVAFFELVAFLNHSRDPNCTSLRMRGNMAIFAARDIAKGEELSHSYIPSNLLLAEAQVRRKHLHFVCECQRCQRERPAERPCCVELAELGFPADHVKTASGKRPRRCVLAITPPPALLSPRQAGNFFSFLSAFG